MVEFEIDGEKYSFKSEEVFTRFVEEGLLNLYKMIELFERQVHKGTFNLESSVHSNIFKKLNQVANALGDSRRALNGIKIPLFNTDLQDLDKGDFKL